MRSHENEAIIINREVNAVIVPDGTPVPLKAGLSGFITQALGGSFTIYIEGNLYRIAGEDADAIGKESTRPPELPPDATVEDVRRLAWDQMRNCYDPEIPINIVDLGLIYRCEVRRNAHGGRSVEIDMTLTAPGCGMGNVIATDVWNRVMEVPTMEEAKVEVVFDPPWDASRMTEAARLQTGMF
jgi:probable FeS assembly SUF system protein SufT